MTEEGAFYDSGKPGGARRLPTRADGIRGELREAAFVYNASPPKPDLKVVRRRASDALPQKGGGKMKTSVYLEMADVSRLSWLADVEGRPQAEIIRDAIRVYRPQNVDREFALFRGVRAETATTVDLTEEDIERLMEGFGDDGAADNDR